MGSILCKTAKVRIKMTISKWRVKGQNRISNEKAGMNLTRPMARSTADGFSGCRVIYLGFS
jgi:hypothetical protein